MTISFFKLHVSGDDFILIDRTKKGHETLLEHPESLAQLAIAICDRNRAVGACGVIFIGPESTEKEISNIISIRVFDRKGKELHHSGDSLLCVARWAFDSGKVSSGRVKVRTYSEELTLSALDSRSFAFEVKKPEPDSPGRLELILDGRPETAFILKGNGFWAATIGRENGPSPQRVRQALGSAVPSATPVIARLSSRDLIRFSTIRGADRTGASIAAVTAAVLSGRMDGSAVAEWRGKGSAVSFAHFSPDKQETTGSGPGALIDRGRFFIEPKSTDHLLVAGMAEYSFDGNFDWDL